MTKRRAASELHPHVHHRVVKQTSQHTALPHRSHGRLWGQHCSDSFIKHLQSVHNTLPTLTDIE